MLICPSMEVDLLPQFENPAYSEVLELLTDPRV